MAAVVHAEAGLARPPAGRADANRHDVLALLPLVRSCNGFCRLFRQQRSGSLVPCAFVVTCMVGAVRRATEAMFRADSPQVLVKLLLAFGQQTAQ